MKRREFIAGLGAAATWSVVARGQDNYPTRPVKIMIAFPVGGLLDTVSRVVGEKLTGLLGQQFIIEARPGAGGTIATAAIAKAEPDGYTIMMINDNHALNPSVFKNIPYDSVKDFAPIGFVGSTPLVFAAHPSVAAKDVGSFVALAKEKPGTITYGSVGLGSASHLAGEMLSGVANIKLQHIPYRGGAPALIDLLAGHVNKTDPVGATDKETQHSLSVDDCSCVRRSMRMQNAGLLRIQRTPHESCIEPF